MKERKPRTEKSKPKHHVYPDHLVELAAEFRANLERSVGGLPSVQKLEKGVIEKEEVIQFIFADHPFAIGHWDRIYPDSNGTRGVRHIRFYSAEKVVFSIEGDYEDRQFGSNFKFRNIELYTPGDWETDFMKLADDLQAFKAERREAFKQKRAQEPSGQERGHSRL